MKLTSPVFTSEELIPKKYTCDGADMSPPLIISDAPDETKSFCLIVQDPDAPGGDFVHWIVWNIDPRVSEIKESATPVGAHEGTTDMGRVGWGGPCPPSGTHRYEFHLYALNTLLDLPATSTKVHVRDRIKSSILAEAVLVGLYKRI